MYPITCTGGKMAMSFDYELTIWIIVLLENLIVTHGVKKFPTFYGT
jgi:hypothetical protein